MLWIGFWIPPGTRPCPADEQLLYEEQVADIMGRLVLGMVAARCVRTIYIVRGWPHRALRILNGGDEAGRTMRELENDFKVFEKLEKLADRGDADAKKIVGRHAMRVPCVKQLVTALQRAPTVAWTSYDKLVGWLKKEERRMVGSLICEDGFNVQKNSNIVKGKRRYMRPQKACALLARKEVVRY